MFNKGDIVRLLPNYRAGSKQGPQNTYAGELCEIMDVWLIGNTSYLGLKVSDRVTWLYVTDESVELIYER